MGSPSLLEQTGRQTRSLRHPRRLCKALTQSALRSPRRQTCRPQRPLRHRKIAVGRLRMGVHLAQVEKFSLCTVGKKMVRFRSLELMHWDQRRYGTLALHEPLRPYDGGICLWEIFSLREFLYIPANDCVFGTLIPLKAK